MFKEEFSDSHIILPLGSETAICSARPAVKEFEFVHSVMEEGV